MTGGGAVAVYVGTSTKSLPHQLLSHQLQYDIWMDQLIMSSEQKLQSNVTEQGRGSFELLSNTPSFMLSAGRSCNIPRHGSDVAWYSQTLDVFRRVLVGGGLQADLIG